MSAPENPSIVERLRACAPETGFAASMSDACLMDEAADTITELVAVLEKLIEVHDLGHLKSNSVRAALAAIAKVQP